MVTLVTGVTTLINVVLIPVIASVFGSWITGGLDTDSIINTVTDFFSKLI